jgi:hypothetical protein
MAGMTDREEPLERRSSASETAVDTVTIDGPPVVVHHHVASTSMHGMWPLVVLRKPDLMVQGRGVESPRSVTSRALLDSASGAIDGALQCAAVRYAG